MPLPNVLGKIFPPEIITVESDIENIEETLYFPEAVLVEKACKERKKQFTAGRLAVRKALAQLDVVSFPLLNADSGLPIWPDKIVGSIAHSKKYCGVAVARKEAIKSIGLDIELAGRIKKETWPLIFTAGEIKFLELLASEEERLLISSLIFSAKECFYKFQYPLTGLWLDFKDIEVNLNLERHRFSIHNWGELNAFFRHPNNFSGNFIFEQGYVITGYF